MPPKTSAAKPSPTALPAWRVVGGASSGGLVVREGVQLKSRELPEKLACGSVILELELQGERLRYKRLQGSGPVTGWVSTKLKGKDIIVRHKLKVWIMCAGTRGDVQPYLALGVGLSRAGFDVAMWSCEDYRKFVESYGLRFFDISPSCEQFIKEMTGVQKRKDEKTSGAKTSESDSDVFRDQQLFYARWMYSAYMGKPVGGVSCWDGIPVEQVYALPSTAQWAVGDLIGYFAVKQEHDSLAFMAELAEQYKGIASAKEAGFTLGQLTGEEEAGTEAEPQVAEAGAGSEAKVEAEAEAEKGSEHGEESEYDAWLRRLKKEWQAVIEKVRTSDDCSEALAFGIQGLFVAEFSKDQTLVDGLLQELEKGLPDLLCHNFGYELLAWHLEQQFGIPHVHLCLQPGGLVMTDPSAGWITEETFPLLLKLDPSLAYYGSLEDARKYHVIEIKPSVEDHEKCKVLEQLTGPIFGNYPARDMSTLEHHNRSHKHQLVGFLSSISSKRFMAMMGKASQELTRTLTYTGFWILDDDDQRAGPATMFGGSELLKSVEDFIAAGSKPAYIGWGSCICSRGRHWMCLLAACSLMLAGMRGIVLAGWAQLSYALLEEIVGPEDELGCLAYARQNILFIEKAPQTWLFPLCSVIVIHGGVGTLAAAWRSGVPLLICPVWLDQFPNGFLNMLMGAGYMLSAVDGCTPDELSESLRQAAESKEMMRGAQAVQLSMMRDHGIASAIEYLNNFLMEDVPSGEWRERYLRED